MDARSVSPGLSAVKLSSNGNDSNGSILAFEVDCRRAGLPWRHNQTLRRLNVGQLLPGRCELKSFPFLRHYQRASQASEVGHFRKDPPGNRLVHTFSYCLSFIDIAVWEEDHGIRCAARIEENCEGRTGLRRQPRYTFTNSINDRNCVVGTARAKDDQQYGDQQEKLNSHRFFPFLFRRSSGIN